MISGFCCPVCRASLQKLNNALVCENGHAYDIAKKGYVNLLMSQVSKDKRHGDDKLMIAARRDFLNEGYYLPLAKAVAEEIKSRATSEMSLLDAGCGEAYYTDIVIKTCANVGAALQTMGIDISKDALIFGAKRNPSIEFAVASIFSLPIQNEKVDILLNMFAPYVAEEFSRVLRKGGILVRTFPKERHLWELKQAIYDTPYENTIETTDLEGFEKLDERRITYSFTMHSQEHIQALFQMTPYYYKTSKQGQERAASLTELTTTADFALIVYRKK